MNEQSGVLQNATKQKMIYEISKNNLWWSAYSLLTCLIIQRLIYILSNISWSRTVHTSTHGPLKHSNEFTLWGKRWSYWLETAWPVLVADEQPLSSKASKRTTALIDLVQTKLRQQKRWCLFCNHHLICINNLIGFVRSMDLFYYEVLRKGRSFNFRFIRVLPVIWLPQAFICRNFRHRC